MLLRGALILLLFFQAFSESSLVYHQEQVCTLTASPGIYSNSIPTLTRRCGLGMSRLGRVNRANRDCTSVFVEICFILRLGMGGLCVSTIVGKVFIQQHFLDGEVKGKKGPALLLLVLCSPT